MATARGGRSGGGGKACRAGQRAGHRGRQPRSLRGLSRGPAGAPRDRPRPRPRAGAGGADDPALGAADRLGPHVRPDAGRDRRRHPLRGLGCRWRSGPGARGIGGNRALALPPPWRGRADGRDHQPLDAGLDRRQPRAWQPGLLQPERGARQGAALRRQWPRGHRAPALDGRGAGAGARGRARGPGRARAQAVDGAGPAHGRRGPQPERRGVIAAAQAPGAGAAPDQGRAGADRRGRRLHRRQRSLLPQPLDGRLQGHARCRSGSARAAAW